VWGKYDGLFARFALILHLAAYAAGEEDHETISADSVAKAADLAEYFKGQAKRVHRQLGDAPEDKILNALYNYIAARPGQRCSLRDLTRAGLSGCKSTAALRTQLQKLVDAGLGTFESVKLQSGKHSPVFVLTDGGRSVG